MKRPTRGALGVSVAAIAAVLCVWGAPAASAQSDSAPPTSRGENFSNKPAPALFQGDCTGGGCHKGPQGLAKGQSQSGLASFLREHYTNSRESAAALSAYLLKLPPGPAQPSPRAANARETAPSAPARGGPSWFDPESPGEGRPSRQQQQHQQQRPARAAARSGEDAAPTPPASVPSAPAAAEPPARPAREPRNQRGRQQPTAAVAAPPAPEAAPPPPPPAPPPPQWDIFD